MSNYRLLQQGVYECQFQNASCLEERGAGGGTLEVWVSLVTLKWNSLSKTADAGWNQVAKDSHPSYVRKNREMEPTGSHKSISRTDHNVWRK